MRAQKTTQRDLTSIKVNARSYSSMLMTRNITTYLNKITKIIYAFVGIVVISLIVNFVYISSQYIKPSSDIIKSEYVNIKKDEIYKEVEFVLKILELLKEEHNIYNSDIPKNIKDKAINLINRYNNNNDNYIFALDERWNVIIHQDSSLINHYNHNFYHIINKIKEAIESGENWVTYDNRPQYKLDENKDLKYSYVTYLPDWNMTIGSGYSKREIASNADTFIHKVNVLVHNNKVNILIINLILVLLSVIFATIYNLDIKLKIVEYKEDLAQHSKQVDKILSDLDTHKSRDPITSTPNKKAAFKFLDISTQISKDLNLHIHIFEVNSASHKSLISGCNSSESILVEFSSSLIKIDINNNKLFHIEHDRFLLITKTINDKLEIQKNILDKLEDNLSNILLCGNTSQISFTSASVKFNDKNETLDSLLEKCEYALCHAKSEGLTHLFYSDHIELDRQREIGLSLELMSAIQKDELEVHYQPQFCTNTNRVTGLEALVRWNNKRYGDVSPAEFIPLSEIKGQIHDIGIFVIRTALKDMKQIGDLTMTINVLPIELLAPNFESFMQKTITELEVDTSKLIFDITKQIPINDIDKASYIMNRLKKIGIKFSISSVGIGQSSLKYICELPVDEIKIPLKIVNNIGSHNKYQQFIKSAINFANSTGLSIVLEGVETKIQYQHITELPSTQVQGFNLSRAKPIAEIIKELKN